MGWGGGRRNKNYKKVKKNYTLVSPGREGARWGEVGGGAWIG